MNTGNVPNSKERLARTLQFAMDTFLDDADLAPHSVRPGIAVSFSEVRDDRTSRGANTVVPGWHTIIPTKATNALAVAQEAVLKIKVHSQQKLS